MTTPLTRHCLSLSLISAHVEYKNCYFKQCCVTIVTKTCCHDDTTWGLTVLRHISLLIHRIFSKRFPIPLGAWDIRLHHMSLVVRKPAFCICENKNADQLRGNREADQRLCFRSTDSTIPLLPKSKISSI